MYYSNERLMKIIISEMSVVNKHENKMGKMCFIAMKMYFWY